MLKSHIAGQPHRIRQSSSRASISFRTAAQRRSRSASEGVGYSTSLRMALCVLRRSSAEVEPMPLVRTPPWLREYDVAKADGPSNIRSSPRKRGPSVTDCGPWIPAYAGMSGSEALRRALFRRALAQDVPELGLERGERFHQRGGIELPGDAGRQLVCGIIGKMSPVCLAIQHRAAPRCCPWSIAWSGLRLG